jgi:glycerate kinase
MLKPKERDPLQSSSFGVGELIQKAIYSGLKKIMVCMGDSATTDVGIGMLSALGAQFFNKKGDLIEPTVLSMSQVARINIDHFDERIGKTEFIGLADTSNSLCGDEGHVSVYGEQKGLKPKDLQMLSQTFDHIGRVMEDQFGVPVRETPYTSPSGGIASAIKAVLGGRIIPTLDYLDSLISFRKSLTNSHIVITGEGCLDRSSKYGKVPYVVAKTTRSPCLLILGGYTQEGQDDFREFDHVQLFCLQPSLGVKCAEVDIYKMISNTTQLALKALSTGNKMPLLKTKDGISA